MGFFSKIFKGVKKVFKKIGKGIKSAFKKFGKFMGKIGILGQVAMFFIMPYVGAALGGAFTGAAGALATNTVGGALGAVGQAAGKVMQFVGNTVSKAGNVFNNITKGVTDTLGNFAKTASNKMFGTSFDAASNFFGAGDSAFSRSFGKNSRFANLTSDNVFFEDIKKSRQVELDRKTMNTLDEVVTESASDSRAYGQTDFIADPNIEQAIGRGDTNLTASLDPTIQDPQALAQQQAKELALGPNLTGSENFSRVEIPSDPTLQMSALDAGVTTVDAPSLLERLKTGVKGIPDAVYKKAGEIADDPLGYAFKGTEESLQKQMNLRVGQELGISEKPVYNQQYVSNAAYVPSMDSFASPQSQYGAQEIMDSRAFEQQVTFNPNPYGYTAFQYGNYMSQFGQTA
jgi:hypothetical protein